MVGAAPTIDSKGYMRGFDVRTGKRKWIFHTIPRKGEFGYDTWTKPGPGGSRRQYRLLGADVGGSGAGPDLCRRGVAADRPDRASTRTGPNLFGETLVALDIETGIRKWHYQLMHHGLWDRDVCCASVICDIPHDGKIVKAIAQPTKQGYVYVLDRETGKPIWPIPERKVAKGDVPGEWYSPTQPIPSASRRLSTIRA